MFDSRWERWADLQVPEIDFVNRLEAEGRDPTCKGCRGEYHFPKHFFSHTCTTKFNWLIAHKARVARQEAINAKRRATIARKKAAAQGTSGDKT